MRYYNNLTTPSGKYCTLNELSNREYLILLKFLQGDNYKGFFENLDLKIKETIDDFDEYDIVDKSYIYLAMCAYCVRGVARVSNNMIGDQDIQLATLLDNIEKSYKEKRIEYNINDKIKLTFGNPTSFYIDENNNLIIDFLSNLIMVNDVKVSKNDAFRLLSLLSTKQKALIEEKISNNLKDKFDIFEGVPMNKLELPLYRQHLLLNVAHVFGMGLKSFYDVLYMCIKHVKMAYDGFMDLTFIETDILLKTCLEEKQREAEQMNINNN